MGMVLTQNVTHAGGGFLKGLVRGQTAFVHGIENPAMHRLEAVAHVGQSAAYDDAHGVFNIGFFHFGNQRRLGDHLIGEENVLRLVVAVMTGHVTSPP